MASKILFSTKLRGRRKIFINRVIPKPYCFLTSKVATYKQFFNFYRQELNFDIKISNKNQQLNRSFKSYFYYSYTDINKLKTI